MLLVKKIGGVKSIGCNKPLLFVQSDPPITPLTFVIVTVTLLAFVSNCNGFKLRCIICGSEMLGVTVNSFVANDLKDGVAALHDMHASRIENSHLISVSCQDVILAVDIDGHVRRDAFNDPLEQPSIRRPKPSAPASDNRGPI